MTWFFKRWNMYRTRREYYPRPHRAWMARAWGLHLTLYRNKQSLSTIYMSYLRLWVEKDESHSARPPLYTAKTKGFNIPIYPISFHSVPTFHPIDPVWPRPFSRPAWQKSRQSWSVLKNRLPPAVCLKNRLLQNNPKLVTIFHYFI